DRIAIRKLASGDQSGAHGPEKARANSVISGIRVRIRSRLKTLHADTGTPVVSGQYGNLCSRDGRDSRLSAELVFEAFKQGARLFGLVTVKARRYFESDHVLSLESKLHAADVVQAFRKQAGGDEQHHGQGNLSCSQGGTKARRRARSGRLSGLSFQRR